MRRYGTVKWFGGINNKTGRENRFGFITDISGEDVYLNIKEWKGSGRPAEGQILSYEYVQASGDKAKAAEAMLYSPQEPASQEEFCSLMALFADLRIDVTKKYGLENRLVEQARTYFSIASIDEIFSWLLDFGSGATVSSVIYCWDGWDELVDQIYEKHGASLFAEIPIERLGKKFIEAHEEQAADSLINLEKSSLLRSVSSSGGKFPDSLILYLVACGALVNESELGSYRSRLERYVASMVWKNKIDYPSYVSRFIDEKLKPEGGLRTISLVRPAIEKSLYKRYLHEKSIKAAVLFQRSRILRNIPEYMVLNALFEPLLAGNDLDVVYAVFFDKLWSLIVAGRLVPGNGLETLFPSCAAMPDGLSCEAVYWENQDIYLCRGSRCSRPAVLPNLSREVRDYSIYDWFAHFGINYFSDSHPSRKDFPIKIAGYFNRLVEIYPRIHCRSCDQLMAPDFKYSRVQRAYYEDGARKLENLAAAYRCTVFKCKTEGCTEFGKGHYINHCIGHQCSNVIDSRDCVAKCDSGRFICNDCCSCCSECAKSNPDGLCPKCASPIMIYENVGPTAKRFKNLFIQCRSSNCDFYIPSERLSRKFYLKSCSPPREVKTSGPVKY
ncbi:hypothetical protein GM160_04160 [Guyparkeria halophila]|uniref:CSD domain-containing protein n=1 Tax=Guyparkeria halophila TaxID=47960 RepID=A0A6I6D2L2_9GAMM|nr:cold shock domain-containing protein [Guyparkeria halophila]QGT78153.1 hypothetical protein GM160_04160 [Guyparkeria halophila]